MERSATQLVYRRLALQVTIESDYVAVDCLTERQPVVVPARTFLSQLI